MILGRPVNLIVGAIGALFNVVVVFHLGGFTPTADQIGVVNVAILAIVSVIANSNTAVLKAASGP